MRKRTTRFFVLVGDRAYECDSMDVAEAEIENFFGEEDGIDYMSDEVTPLFETMARAVVRVYRKGSEVAYVVEF